MPGAWPAPNSSSGGSAPAPAGQGCAAGLEGHLAEFSAPVPALLAVLMGLAALATVLGNALVALAFVVDRSLRTHRNFFFLNLAIADFMVGAFCIPLYIPYTLTGKWMFGRGLCKLWLVIDYVVCAASVFNIVLISFDRLISVTKAVSYRAQKGRTKSAVVKMAMVWVMAFLLYGPAIISWEHITHEQILADTDCYAEFFCNWYFLLIASIIEFFTPFISITYFSLSIYCNIRKRMKRNQEKPGNRSFSMPSQPVELNLSPELHPVQGDAESRSPWNVAKALAILVCVFALCWAPYTLMMIVRAACKGQCIPQGLYEATFWLLWLNSAINPVLYPLCHMSFRKAFFKLFCPGKAKIHPRRLT
uniref:Histamine H3 receptor n=1 Tax=Varanus komodoensis TaxID=61221 RepID=A0A8D2IZ54_VARKO